MNVLSRDMIDIKKHPKRTYMDKKRNIFGEIKMHCIGIATI